MEVGKNPCKKCQAKGGDRSGNNYHFYGEGLGGHCFSCGFSVPSDAFKEENGMNKDEDYEDDVMTREKITPEEAARIKGYTGVATQDYRGIRTETSKPFGVRYQYDEESGEVVKMFVPSTENTLATALASCRRTLLIQLVRSARSATWSESLCSSLITTQ